MNLPDAGRPHPGYERETAGHAGARIVHTLFGARFAKSQQTGADAHIGSVRVAAARPDYAARRGPSRKSAAAGCGLHRYIPN